MTYNRYAEEVRREEEAYLFFVEQLKTIETINAIFGVEEDE